MGVSVSVWVCVVGRYGCVGVCVGVCGGSICRCVCGCVWWLCAGCVCVCWLR
eukprot:NODE_1438_length_952_cov_87.900332_g1113_i0.p4 GENE.NODE_1438_length_952_cov_87.900332_g1113_i0~~NODE_1438_length_952_cov_87.900332_g1113_i0.p4  ORF type:complete len:52 (+),score=29.37 NODE_1438_length_952_cov_87.900332_g1113_i0:153-308(+)